MCVHSFHPAKCQPHGKPSINVGGIIPRLFKAGKCSGLQTQFYVGAECWMHRCHDQVSAPLELELRQQVQGLPGMCPPAQPLRGAMLAVDHSSCSWGCWRLGEEGRTGLPWLELVRGYSTRSKEQRVNNKGLSLTSQVSDSVLCLPIDRLLCTRHSSEMKRQCKKRPSP